MESGWAHGIRPRSASTPLESILVVWSAVVRRHETTCPLAIALLRWITDAQVTVAAGILDRSTDWPAKSWRVLWRGLQTSLRLDNGPRRLGTISLRRAR